jgi:hypothetical protein
MSNKPAWFPDNAARIKPGNLKLIILNNFKRLKMHTPEKAAIIVTKF